MILIRAHHNIKQPRKGQSLAHLENHNKTYEYAKRFAEKKSNTYSEIQTKSLPHVKEFLGHAEIDNTLRYIQIE